MRIRKSKANSEEVSTMIFSLDNEIFGEVSKRKKKKEHFFNIL